jgi:Flp pilus assembly protein TadD
MFWKHLVLVASIGAAALLGTPCAHAGDLKITIPRHSKLTPVQSLNREGVDAVRRHNYRKAEQCFYKAYLLDPDDPFTLNNLGYVSELQGQIDRAQGYYTLAKAQMTDAVIDQASSRRFEGQPLSKAFAPDQPLQIDHDNVESTRLLSQRRAFEADTLLQHALQADPHNVFALNNMGVAKEMEGEPQEALKYYDEAAALHSTAGASVTLDRRLQGRSVSEIARDSARALRSRMENGNNVEEVEEQVAALNVRGVAAANRNDLRTADENFRKAYALDPNNAFTLNNVGYVAELEGDRETAQFFYDRAQKSGDANTTVGLATRRSAEGMKLFAVAANSDTSVDSKMAQERASLRQSQEPVVLHRRDGSLVDETAPPETPAAEQPGMPPNGSQPPQ